MLTFNIAGETFALEAAIVREILDLVPETKVPGSRPFVNAVINFRSKVIPLADIRVALGVEPCTHHRQPHRRRRDGARRRWNRWSACAPTRSMR